MLGFDRSNPWFFVLAAATAGPLIYRDRLKFPVWALTLGLTACLGFDSAHWSAGGAHFPSVWRVLAVLGAWGGAMVLLGRLHDRWAGVAPLDLAWRLPGHLLLGFALPFFTFHEAVRDFLRGDAPIPESRFFLSGAAIAAVGLFCLHWRNFRARARSAADRGALAEAGAAAAVLALLFLKPGVAAWPWVIAFDALYLAECAALICLADRVRVWWTGYLGVAMFTAFVVCRYFEYAVRLLPRSFVFIAAGAILLAGGVFLERRRRAGGNEAVP